MTHALNDFIVEQMSARKMTQANLAKKSGLTRAHVSKLVNDDRDRLPQLPHRKTLAKLADAFGASESALLAVAVEALGRGFKAEDFVYEVASASDRDLLDEIARRMELAKSPTVRLLPTKAERDAEARRRLLEQAQDAQTAASDGGDPGEDDERDSGDPNAD